MTDDDFNAVFGRRPEARPTFVERVARPPAAVPAAILEDQRRALELEAATAVKALAEIDQYKAFGFIPAGQLNASCEVRSWIDGTDVPDGVVFFYRLLIKVGFTGSDELRLTLPDSLIVISGRNLDPLRQALTRQQATFIQQHHRRRWAVPKQDDLLVDQIQIVRA